MTDSTLPKTEWGFYSCWKDLPVTGIAYIPCFPSWFSSSSSSSSLDKIPGQAKSCDPNDLPQEWESGSSISVCDSSSSKSKSKSRSKSRLEKETDQEKSQTCKSPNVSVRHFGTDDELDVEQPPLVAKGVDGLESQCSKSDIAKGNAIPTYSEGECDSSKHNPLDPDCEECRAEIINASQVQKPPRKKPLEELEPRKLKKKKPCKEKEKLSKEKPCKEKEKLSKDKKEKHICKCGSKCLCGDNCLCGDKCPCHKVTICGFTAPSSCPVKKAYFYPF